MLHPGSGGSAREGPLDSFRRLARVLEEEARRSDVVARLGGDEFALIVPASDAANAMRLGRRIVRRLERLVDDVLHPLLCWLVAEQV